VLIHLTESDVEMQSYNAPQGGRYAGGLPTGPRPGGAGQAGGYNDNVDTSYNNAGMAATDGNDILNSCQAIDRTIDELEERLQNLQGLHNRVLNDRATNAEVDRTNSEIMNAYRALGDRLKKVKSKPDSGSPRNAPQVGRVDRRLKKAINDYQRVESDFRKQMQEQQARQYRIVRPEATDAEVQEAVEDPNVQVFQQAVSFVSGPFSFTITDRNQLLNSDRRGQSQSTLNAVRQRHNEIQRIEQTIIELAQLFQDLDVIVMEQEPLVQNIEAKGEEVQENMVKANEHLDLGVKSARGARKKKWICLGIVVLVVIVIAIAVGAYIAVNKPFSKKPSKRAVEVMVEAVHREMAKRQVGGLKVRGIFGRRSLEVTGS
jgi:syntaxin 1B/2/3